MSNEVLDTAALISWPIIRLNGCYATPNQKAELSNNFPEKEIKIQSAEIVWIEPSENGLQAAIDFAIETGDMAGLSKTDLGILALSIDLNKTLVTDDYRLQNIAEKAGIRWVTVNTEGIRELWKWELKCMACKKIYPQPKITFQEKSDWGECEDCGSSLKLKKIR